MALDKEQKAFITHRVHELGSLSAVESVYIYKDKVAQFAIKLAKKLYKPKRHRLKGGSK